MTYEIDDALRLITDLLQLAEDVGDDALAKHTDLAGLGAMFLARAGQSVFSAGPARTARPQRRCDERGPHRDRDGHRLPNPGLLTSGAHPRRGHSRRASAGCGPKPVRFRASGDSRRVRVPTPHQRALWVPGGSPVATLSATLSPPSSSSSPRASASRPRHGPRSRRDENVARSPCSMLRRGHPFVGQRRSASRISGSTAASGPTWNQASSTAARAIAGVQPRPTSASRACMGTSGASGSAPG